LIAVVADELVEENPDCIIVSVGGIGLRIDIPLSTYQSLGPPHSQVRIETVMHVRDDGMQLFGFATMDEKNLFEMLVMLPSIGPGLALNVLSGATVAEFTAAIINEDISKLVSLPKFGSKTAQRLIMELRDRITALRSGQTDAPAASPLPDEPETNDAILGLVALGYDQSEARKQVVRVSSQSSASMKSTEIIRAVLRNQGG